MNYETCLKEKKIKVTKARIAVLSIIDNADDAITADCIYEKSINNGSSLDLSTVYRSLELFVEKSLVDKFDLGNGKYNYKIKGNNHKHKIECSSCHKKVEIECPMISIEELIKNKTGFTLLEHELKLKAVCEECKNKNKSKKH